MKIKLLGRASGPHGCWAAGDEMTVGKDITKESADHLVASRQATWVEEAPVRVEEVETAEAQPAPENTAKAPAKRRPRKRRS